MALSSVFWVVALVVVTLGRPGVRTDDGPLNAALAMALALVAVMTCVVHSNGADGGDLSGDLRAAPVEGGRLLLHPRDAAAAVLCAAAREQRHRRADPGRGRERDGGRVRPDDWRPPAR